MKKSLTKRIYILMFMTISLFSVSLILVNSYRNAKFINEERALMVKSITSSVNESLVESLKQENITNLYKVVATVCKHQTFARCILKKGEVSFVDINMNVFRETDEIEEDLKYAGKTLGQLIFIVKKYTFEDILTNDIYLLSIVLLVSILFSFILFELVLKDPLKEMSIFSKMIKNIKNKEDELKVLSYIPRFEEAENFSSSFKDYIERLHHVQKQIFEHEKIKQYTQISRQIAHDIRSPLEALRSVTGHIDELDFQHRKIITSSIQRISDIANGLLREGRGVDKVGLVNLNILIEEVYQDKIFEQGNNIKLVNNITYNDSFVYGDENALYRVLSNIINNSFEAYKSTKGEVIIEVDVSNSFVEIKVQDFGEGMSSEFVQKIIEGGVTTKDKGNGLGVSSAKNEISKHNGKFMIDSKIGVGTIIKIELPRVLCPNWFSSIIEVDLSMEKIICVDDDPAFLEFYQEKLKEFKDKTVCISARNFEDHIISKNNQYFFDYDLGNDKTGLDFILDNNISHQSTLVTSMYQDKKVQDICSKNGIKVLPKQIFNTAKVKIKNEVKASIIFIDNDDLMHLAWKMEASKKGISIKTYFSVDEFLDDADKFSNEIKIYIDSDLGDGIRGEVESKKIFDNGFINLYLATGYLAEDISKPDWIIDIVGKRPTFLT